MTRMSLPAPTLLTARLRPRPFDDADANDLFALHSKAYVLRYWDAPPWSERARSERFITACRQMAAEGTGFMREGTLREDCVVNGEVSDSWVYGLIRREWRPSSEPAHAR
jgi:RimJ/RimL family protein N-acetyltransferase